jgi:hypothetical protein
MRILWLIVMLAATMCGEEVRQPAPATAPVVSTQAQHVELAAAIERWQINRPHSYRLRYSQVCECVGGPWTIGVVGDDTVEAFIEVDWATDDSIPYRSVDALLASIEATLDAGDIPIEVAYHPELGYPTEYTFNPPGLPVDAGFVLSVLELTALD